MNTAISSIAEQPSKVITNSAIVKHLAIQDNKQQRDDGDGFGWDCHRRSPHLPETCGQVGLVERGCGLFTSEEYGLADVREIKRE